MGEAARTHKKKAMPCPLLDSAFDSHQNVKFCGVIQMPRKVTILQVFVASPSDVQEERNALEEVVRELNLIWDRSQAVKLDLW